MLQVPRRTRDYHRASLQRLNENENEMAWHVAICGQSLPLKHRSVIRRVQKVTAGYFEIEVDDITGRDKRSCFVLPRHVAMTVASKFTGFGPHVIGRHFKRDHGTVIKALRSLKRKSDVDLGIGKALLDVEWLVRFELERPL